ncbi:Bifunctional NMN adenylyltransferase/Nudix hydrolase [Rubripirellula obstinata]|uniref:Bifunctional NMN adenylyltransferase/Nudix hydrolase n=1 Tax=Rubripirellula obstinata TaxID=406547 RepID=A0A5B1CLP7_9BACT|nr:NUDIX domain-containing protein [Rubripirellula obstinata]KAA1262127.1 Bifunctional NMN adenylyltransferase/Nudix hydrolase [Rubripirellula obstinata]
MSHTYRYPRPALTVDIVVFGLDAEDLQVLLIERDGKPFRGQWALPGGFVDVGESPDDAARRELEEETGLSEIFLEQLYTFGNPGRDPREHVVTIAHYALVNLNEHDVKASSDARNAAWFSINDLPKLAFDHSEILKVALDRLRAKVRYQPIGFELLPKKFTLRQLQHLYELILDRELDKRNFRKKVLATEIVKETNQFEKDVAHRAARLYRFDQRKYDRMTKQGFNFEV